jgi:hypothetical protein
MILSKKTLGLGILILVLVLAVGFVANAEISKACGSKTSARATTVSATSGCAAAQMGACSGKAMAGCTGAMKAGSSCGAVKGTKTASAAAVDPVEAGPMFPKGTMVSVVEVPGGRDLIFNGPDLAAVETALREHVATCAGQGTCASKTANTCAVATSEKAVVLSVRGPDPEQCCLGLTAAQASADPGKAAGACPQTCPHAKAAAKGKRI